MDQLVAYHDGSGTDTPSVAFPSRNLVYVTSLEGGITRKPGSKGFRYYTADGVRVTDPQELARFAAMAIPPAYTDVIISADPNSHLQAIGIDARGRKQYSYHPDWSAERGKAKFEKLALFAASLPKIRERVDADLRSRTLTFEKAVATVVYLMDNLYIRVGNANYTAANGSFGLTTLRNRHVKIDGSVVHFRFKGKSGKQWRVSHADRRIAGVIKRIQELPGQNLFQYLDADGKAHQLRSQDVNDYIRVASGGEFSSRQFRTWGATCLAAFSLASIEVPASKRERTMRLNAVIDAVASKLVNTRSVCRSSYIHPKVFEDFEAGRLTGLAKMRKTKSARLLEWMDEDEICVLRWLRSKQASAAFTQ